MSFLKRRKKLVISIITVVLSSVVVFFVCAYFWGGNGSLVSIDKKTNYKVQSEDDFKLLANYEFSENDPNIWDYYSVDYDLMSLEVEYREISYRSGFSQMTKYYELLSADTFSLKGTMAHSDGIYYIRERADGLVVEVLFDAIYNAFAVSVSGLEVFAELFDLQCTNGWLAFQNSSNEFSSSIKGALKLANHFYDRDFFKLFNTEGAYSFKDNKYFLNQTPEILQSKELHDWYDVDNILPNFSGSVKWEVTSYSVVIDVVNRARPKVDFELSCYYPSIDKTIKNYGTLKYNYINNTLLKIPEEVKKKWKEFEGYKRRF